MKTPGSLNKALLSLPMFCTALGVCPAFGCSARMDGFVSLGSDIGGSAQGGVRATGGATNAGSNRTSGGTMSTASLPMAGGTVNSGGAPATGGSIAMGGAAIATGGETAGGAATGGAAIATGGEAPGGEAAGGAATGGAATGGAATGGAATGGASTAGDTGGAGGTSSAASSIAVGGSGVTVQLDKTHQTIQGFGIGDTWANGALPSKVFSTTDVDGLGLSILRVGMSDNGGDYSSNISGDIATAKAAGAKIIGSCWSPPANCKSNNSVNDGGHLNSSCYASWSDTIVKWAKGHGLYAMSIGDSPDFASCGIDEPCNGNYPTTLYTAKEMVEWVKVAGPKLQQEGIKVIAPEVWQWIRNWSNISATGSVPSGKNSSDPLKCGCFGNTLDAATEAQCSSSCASGDGYDYGHWLAKDAAAWAAFDIMGVHEYDTQHAEKWPSDVTEGKVTKEIWQTDMSGVKWWPEQGTGTGSSLTGSTTIENGVAVAEWIHSALVVGEASAWLYFWYKPVGTDDNEGLLVKSGAAAKRYYTLANYSKYVRPGQVMVEVTGNSNSNLLVSAFKGASDNSLVVVAINKGTSAVTVPITIAGGTAPGSCTPYVTSSSDNLKAGTAVTVSSGSFSASLGATSVTTYVCT